MVTAIRQKNSAGKLTGFRMKDGALLFVGLQAPQFESCRDMQE
jgi:hypothetical protein